MKNVLLAFALRFSLLAAAFALVSTTTANAQNARTARPGQMAPFIVEEDRLPPPELNSDGTITLPDGTVITPPTRNSDGTITLADGTVVTPPVRNADGTITLSDGTVITPADRPAPRGPRPTGGN